MNASLTEKKIAKRYVQSLFDAITTKKDQKAVVSDLDDLAAMATNSPALKEFIETPLLSVGAQKDGLVKLCKKAKLSDWTLGLLLAMADNRRLSLLPVVIEETYAYIAEQSGIMPVSVTSAQKLSLSEQKKITTELEKISGKQISMQSLIDESLIGGVVIKAGSVLIDGSVKTKLDQLERNLTAKAA